MLNTEEITGIRTISYFKHSIAFKSAQYAHISKDMDDHKIPDKCNGISLFDHWTAEAVEKFNGMLRDAANDFFYQNLEIIQIGVATN